MSKVYCIFYTRAGRVVWGIGGRSGRDRESRSGHQLPGGTITREKQAKCSTDDIRDTVLKELGEELGKTHKKTILDALTQDRGKGVLSEQVLDGHRVYFCFMEIKPLLFPPGLHIAVKLEDIEGEINEYDEPYTHLLFHHYNEAIQDRDTPSWFKKAMDQLIRREPVPFTEISLMKLAETKMGEHL